jgi:hypothetical protein
MTPRFPEFAELQALLDALCEESITPEQVRRLEELVLTRPEAEAYYVQYLSLQADLVGHTGVLPAPAEQVLRARVRAVHPGVEPQPAAPGEVGPPPPPARRRPRLLFWGTLGPAGLAAGLLLALMPGPRPRVVPPSADEAPEALDNTVAVLLQAPEAEWFEGDAPPRAGGPLAPGWLRLKSGYALLEFYSGAIAILQGPAEFQLISRTEAYCSRGKVRVTVPPQAQGFTVGSPKLDLVDRGTEFGLAVGAGGKTEVHVIRGEVELYDAGARRAPPARQALTTGQGVRLDGAGAVRRIASDPGAFPTAQDLAARAQEETRRRQGRWLTASAALRRDPDLVAYYPFQAEPPLSRTLLDQAAGRQRPHDGAVVGCAWATGRWPGKQGLEFKRVSDRVRLHVPGEFDALTLMTWVRVDALPNRYSSLMMTDGWDEGAPHWHIRQDGKVSLGVKGPGGPTSTAHYFTGVIFSPERVGQWTHLAVVYDRDGGEVTHYVDGRPVKRTPLKLDIPLRIGDAEIGNWNPLYRSDYPVRHLSGCMDEFLLFSRALDGQEVERHYTEGRPPS